jgi:hypothetical protein
MLIRRRIIRDVLVQTKKQTFVLRLHERPWTRTGAVDWNKNLGEGNMKMRSYTVTVLLAVMLWAANAGIGFAQNNTIFGPNVYVFSPGSDAATQTTLNTKAVGGISQFGTGRVAVFFMPGTYNIEAEIGFNEAVYGLGANPTDVVINGYITPNYSGAVSTNMTTNFWRSISNLTFNPGHNTSQNNPPNTLQWGVSQGTSLRRLQINGNLQLDGSELGTTGICGWASGGFVSDLNVTGYIDPCAQQQWYTRNSTIGSWDDVLNVWNQGHIDNMVFSGVIGAPPQSFATADPRSVPDNTVLVTTPRSREKPFVYIDSSSNFWVFVPTLQTNSSGATWTGGGLGTGYSLPISDFYIATPTSTLAQINAALASGQNLILTPGQYKYSGSINVTNPDTIVLGLGYADLLPQTGTPAISVADVDGVSVSGLLIDAGTPNSAVQLQIGVAGAPRVRHIADPTWLSDIFIRVGGAVAGTATTSLEVDSDDVILDNLWLWRADHGTDASWTGNLAPHGLVVNGDYVLASGLAVEHYQQNQVVWNGNGGETIFFQDEAPYDPPSQAAWMDGSIDGYSPYYVSPLVTTHQAYGLGIYCNFTAKTPVLLESAITVPVAAGVTVTDALTYNLNSVAGGGIAHVVNNQGAAVGAGTNTTAYLPSYGGVAGTVNLATSPSLTLNGDGSYEATVTITNTGTGAAQNAVLTGLTIGGVSGTPVPYSLGGIAPGASVIATVSIPASAGAPDSRAVMSITGTYTGGTFGGSFRATLP